MARLAEAVALYGGTIDKFMGDAVMALFGAPIAHEDDPIRAVHAALAMHQAVAALRQLDRDGNALELRLRIGINSGEVIAGIRDVGGHREYSVFGDVVNTAARLQTAAMPGGILLGEETARQAGHGVRPARHRAAGASGQGGAGPGLQGARRAHPRIRPGTASA